MLHKRRRIMRDHDDSDSESEYEESNIRVVGSNVYFYSEVNMESSLELVEKLKKLEMELLKKQVECPEYTPEIKLYINSCGGDIFAGFSAMDHVSNLRVRVHTIADGQCASAATFILLGGDTRSIHEHAHVLIHQISSGFWGKFEELKDEVKSCERFMNMVNKVYQNKTNIPEKKLKTLMKRDVYLTPEECVKYDIVSCII